MDRVQVRSVAEGVASWGAAGGGASSDAGIVAVFCCPERSASTDWMPEEELDALAERYALGRGGRSARAATQYVDSLLSKP